MFMGKKNFARAGACQGGKMFKLAEQADGRQEAVDLGTSNYAGIGRSASENIKGRIRP
jgi:hypothetical protein